MRFGCCFLLALVLLVFPPEGAAGPARLASRVAAEPPQLLRHPEGRPPVVAIALRYVGVPYRWGGASPAGFDCSGFLMYVFESVGVHLPHNAALQYGLGRSVPRSNLEPGDAVFFNGLAHAGIYVGGGRFVHSPQTGDVVKVSSLSDSWYRTTYAGARRY